MVARGSAILRQSGDGRSGLTAIRASLTASPSTLYHNRGDGTFEDVSVQSGIAAHIGKAMSVSFADYDGDGLMDIFVTNDKMPNFLFHNLGNGKFEEVALEAGAALLDDGREISGMGSDFRDYDNDGLPDIVFTALAGETFPAFPQYAEDRVSRLGTVAADWQHRALSTADGAWDFSI